MPQDLGQEDVVGLVFGLEEVGAVPVGAKLHIFNMYIADMIVSLACMYVYLERLVEGVFFEVLNQ